MDTKELTLTLQKAKVESSTPNQLHPFETLSVPGTNSEQAIQAVWGIVSCFSSQYVETLNSISCYCIVDIACN